MGCSSTFSSSGLGFSFPEYVASFHSSTCFPDSKMCCYYLFSCSLWPCRFCLEKKSVSVFIVRFGEGVKLDGFVQPSVLIQKSLKHFLPLASVTLFSWVSLCFPPGSTLVSCWISLYFLTSTCCRASGLWPSLFFLYSLLTWFHPVLGLQMPSICLGFPYLYFQPYLPYEFRTAYPGYPLDVQ